MKELGLDLQKLDEGALTHIASVVEEAIRKSLEEVLGPRILRYTVTVTVAIESGRLVVSVDTSVTSRVPPTLSLEHIIDRAIKRGFDRVELLLKQRFLKEAKRDHREN
ncbi:MAG: hypothetical protein DRO12_04975 [Thermoprotei archaeon]|nr:MAG: hypothetical protein DRO12_04975 [Thermoprotei archaeon]